MKREANFDNDITTILRKNERERERERERELNFGDVVIKISAQNASCLGGVRREKKNELWQ